MLTGEEWCAWCQRLGLTQDTEALIATIRSSPPVRKVQGRAGNVSGRYPSPQMQRSIQFESQHVELWAIYAMERDDDVLEYYDQPTRMPLCYRALSGRQTTQWHTPDFFVLRQRSAGWEAWKPASALDALASAMPARYQRDSTGEWRCPPGETYAQQVGLTYRGRSSAEYHPLSIQNLKFLQDFWAHHVPLDPAQEARALAHIAAHPGIRLPALLAAHPDMAVDVLWTLIATRRVFTDLTATSLMHHEQVALYGHEAEAMQALAPPESVSPPPSPSPPLVWDGRLFLVEAVGELVW